MNHKQKLNEVYKKLIKYNNKKFLKENLSQKSDKEKIKILYQIAQKYTLTNKFPQIYISELEDNAEYFAGDLDIDNVIKQSIFVDKIKFQDDFVDLLEDFLHELHHFNQEYLWYSKNSQYKQQVIKNKQLPKDFQQKQYGFSEIYDFWNEFYGYYDNPFEIEAREFGRKKFAEVYESLL